MFHQVFICNNDETVTDIEDQPGASFTEFAGIEEQPVASFTEFAGIEDQPVASFTESALKIKEDEQMDEIDANNIKPPDIKMETDVLKVEKEEFDVIDNETLMEAKQELKREEELGNPDVKLELVDTKYSEIFKRKECRINNDKEPTNRKLPKEIKNKFGLINDNRIKSDELFDRHYNNIQYTKIKPKSDNETGIGKDSATKMPCSKSIQNKEALLMKVINSENTPRTGQAIGEEYEYVLPFNEGLYNSFSRSKDLETYASCGEDKELDTDASCGGGKDLDSDARCDGSQDLEAGASCGGFKDLDTDASCGSSKDINTNSNNSRNIDLETDSNSNGSIDFDTGPICGGGKDRDEESILNLNNTINQLMPGVNVQVSLNNTKSNPTIKKSKSRSKIMYNCEICNKVFKRKPQLFDHMNTHSKNKPFKCDTCGKEYNSKTALIAHNKNGHRPNTTVLDKKTVIQELKLCSRDPNKNTFNNDLFMCKKCEACFSTEKNLEQHVNYTLCGGYRRNRKHQCDICGKSFSGANRLAAHLNTHTNNRPFKCSDCEKCFKCNNSLKTHRKTMHEKSLERYLCCYCGVMHESIKHMLAHEQVHLLPEGEEIPKPFKCLECGKGYISKYKLRSHERHHKQMKCPKCPELFQNRDLRYKHLEKVHNTVKEYKCKICSKVFKSGKSFACHKFVHTTVLAFFCDVCDKGFKQKHHLEQHLITHSDYRPIVCPECGETFKRKTHLKQHAAAFHGDGKKR